MAIYMVMGMTESEDWNDDMFWKGLVVRERTCIVS